MGTNLLSYNYEDEEFIDMEVSSSKNREFEFQMVNSLIHSNSPADELFYQGKLLPLHHPPPKVKTLLQNHQEEDFITLSPSESCRVSTELTPDEYFFEWSTELTGFIGDHPKKYYAAPAPWSTKKLRLIKHCSISQKLKASTSYIKSLFYKTSCGSNGNPNCTAKQEIQQDCENGFLKKYLNYPTLAHVLKGIEEQENEDVFVFDTNSTHRKSFSGAIKRKCSSSSTTSSSSSSSSSSSTSFNYSNGIYEVKLLKRNSSSANSELEGSIEAAIDHCKKSQQKQYVF